LPCHPDGSLWSPRSGYYGRLADRLLEELLPAPQPALAPEQRLMEQEEQQREEWSPEAGAWVLGAAEVHGVVAGGDGLSCPEGGLAGSSGSSSGSTSSSMGTFASSDNSSSSSSASNSPNSSGSSSRMCHVIIAGVRQNYNLMRALSYNQEVLRLMTSTSRNDRQAATCTNVAATAGAAAGGRTRHGAAHSTGDGDSLLLGFTACGLSLGVLRKFYKETMVYGQGPIPELGDAGKHHQSHMQQHMQPPDEGGPPQFVTEGRDAFEGPSPPEGLQQTANHPLPSPPQATPGHPALRGWPADESQLKPRALATCFLLPSTALHRVGLSSSGSGSSSSASSSSGYSLPPLAVKATANVRTLVALAGDRLRQYGYCRMRAMGPDAVGCAVQVLYDASKYMALEGKGVIALPYMTELRPQSYAQLVPQRASRTLAATAAAVHRTEEAVAAAAAAAVPPALLDKAPQLVLHLVACEWDEGGRPVLPAGWQGASAGTTTAVSAAANTAGEGPTAAAEAAVAVAMNAEFAQAPLHSDVTHVRDSAASAAPETSSSADPSNPKLLPSMHLNSTNGGGSADLQHPAPSAAATLPPPASAYDSLTLRDRTPSTADAAAAVAGGLSAGRRVRVAAAGLRSALNLPVVLYRAQGRMRGLEAKRRGAVVFTMTTGAQAATASLVAAEPTIQQQQQEQLQGPQQQHARPAEGAVPWGNPEAGMERRSGGSFWMHAEVLALPFPALQHHLNQLLRQANIPNNTRPNAPSTGGAAPTTHGSASQRPTRRLASDTSRAHNPD
ncbi:hypothetical protein Agub_g392, partial [Astrephomene gubernaculifera]